MDFYRDKTVLITGHTGFKGAWMVKVLSGFGAKVAGYALEPPVPGAYNAAELDKEVHSHIGDISDFDSVFACISQHKPDIVIHMAAQPIVTESYKNPLYTYRTNVMGTVNVLEAVRRCGFVRSFVNVTTDKVYENHEWQWGYRENDRLNGYDPYSNSKSCSELVTDSYKKSFFKEITAISTCRSGNVIGGGDFAADRIIPDCIRAAQSGKDIIVRNPYSTRPYQHVLEPVFAYLLIAKAQYENPTLQDSYNIGPNDDSCITTGELADIFCKKWGNVKWVNVGNKDAVHEANFLKLDCSKIKSTFKWSPVWDIETAVEKTVEWSKCFFEGGDVNTIMRRQIDEYTKCANFLTR